MSERVWDEAHLDRVAGLTAASFEQLVGSTLSLVDFERDLTVRAVERAGDEDRPFHVLLDAPTDVDLPQGTYAIEVPGSGLVPLFMVPELPGEHGPRYVVSFG